MTLIIVLAVLEVFVAITLYIWAKDRWVKTSKYDGEFVVTIHSDGVIYSVELNDEVQLGTHTEQLCLKMVEHREASPGRDPREDWALAE